MTKRLDRWITASIYIQNKEETHGLDQIRKDIDRIDQELVALLERRMVCVGQIVEYKEQQGIPVARSRKGKRGSLRRLALS